jgi:hypothetical protein
MLSLANSCWPESSTAPEIAVAGRTSNLGFPAMKSAVHAVAEVIVGGFQLKPQNLLRS